VILEAHHDGFLGASAPVSVPSDVQELRLVLPPQPAPPQ
jgi:hypothetical protein